MRKLAQTSNVAMNGAISVWEYIYSKQNTTFPEIFVQLYFTVLLIEIFTFLSYEVGTKFGGTVIK